MRRERAPSTKGEAMLTSTIGKGKYGSDLVVDLM
jgi:hypothetical protein